MINNQSVYGRVDRIGFAFNFFSLDSKNCYQLNFERGIPCNYCVCILIFNVIVYGTRCVGSA